MNKVARNTYSAYSPRAFTKAERGNVVLLFGGLNWRAERALEGILRNSGHRARALPTPKREDLLRGRELADIG
ncbi:MAG: hypothetical protein ACE5FS_16605, partial [Paracoccaceae bacterium]